MTTLVAQVSPQRSNQYTDLVTTLAPHEIQLSAIGAYLTDDIIPVQLGNQTYLKLTINTDLNEKLMQTLDNLVMTNAYFYYYDGLGDVKGALLKPIEIPSNPALSPDLIATRRYRGKTNELFTQFMCNLARFSSNYANTPWDKLTLLDPLSGGGTTLFAGLILGADVVGVEENKKIIEGTIAFLKQYTKEGRIPAKFREDRLKNVGKRWFITLNQTMRCVVGYGDTRDVEHFVNGLKRPQLLVTDLPYGIQHQAELETMLVDAIPAWADVMADDATMVFAWDASRFPREEMIDLVEHVSNFTVLNDTPYNQLSHRVDRVIKQRDIIVARRL